MKRYELIWRTVKKIPRGRVATYGQIAELAGLDGHARQVGYALHNLPEKSDVPWHRVINAQGEISARSAGDSHELQRMLLEAEGVVFRGERVDLERYRWEGGGKRFEGRGREEAGKREEVRGKRKGEGMKKFE